MKEQSNQLKGLLGSRKHIVLSKKKSLSINRQRLKRNQHYHSTSINHLEFEEHIKVKYIWLLLTRTVQFVQILKDDQEIF